MTLPKIAIVGRPNVGKSALFNRIAGKRIAIVDEAEGITRDRLYAECEQFGRDFDLIDTGGIGAEHLFCEEVVQQAQIAIEEADGLILVVDGQIGPTTLDHEVARLLLQQKKPISLAVNKVDAIEHEGLTHSFYGLGIAPLQGVSATQGRGVSDLLEGLLERIPETSGEVDDPSLKVAIVGRPNVGKSTLLNTLINDSRCIVSPIAGTTRDSIDIPFGPFTLIDTAGIRRKSSEKEVVDKFAAIRTERAIERADLCVLVIDAEQGLTHQDKRIASAIHDAGKGCILFLNKWDLVEGHRMEHTLQALQQEALFLRHCPTLIGSATTGRNLDKIIPLLEQTAEERTKKVATSQLNKFMEQALQLTHPPMINGKRLRVYYMTQVGSSPPRFLLFVNYPDRLAPSYKQYLHNRFRETFGFAGNPVVFQIKKKRSSSSP